MPSIEELSKSYLEDVKAMYENDMTNKDLVASGKTKGMLRVETDAGGGKLYGSKVMIFLKYGRGPGKFPPPLAMVQAIENRGGPYEGMTIEQSAYLLGRKIAAVGTAIFIGPGNSVTGSNGKVYQGRAGIDIDAPLKIRNEKLLKDVGESYVTSIADKLRKIIK